MKNTRYKWGIGLVFWVLAAHHSYCFSLTRYAFTDTTIEWRSDRPLNVSDFLSKDSANIAFNANTSSVIRYTYNFSIKGYQFKIKAFFLPNKSWGATNMSPLLLKHEQLHFDLTELVARKMRAFIRGFEVNDDSLQAALTRLVEILSELNQLNDRYDRETLHGTDKAAQEAWQKMIEIQLAELKEYELKDGIELYKRIPKQ